MIERVETGVIQFEDDWPGIFIRGDNALMLYGPVLSKIANKEELTFIDESILIGLTNLMFSCSSNNDIVTIERK